MSAGIDVERHLLIAWTLTGVVAVIAGVLWTLVAGSGFGGIVPSLTLLAVLAVRPHGLFGRPRIERA
jgi:branched-subunit amino acid ABC-type transport system permease component